MKTTAPKPMAAARQTTLSAKTGGDAAAPDRARNDAEGQARTTNQGVAVGDSQHSLSSRMR